MGRADARVSSGCGETQWSEGSQAGQPHQLQAAPASSHTLLGPREQAHAGRRQAHALGPQVGAAGELDFAHLKILVGCM